LVPARVRKRINCREFSAASGHRAAKTFPHHPCV
jgi:hypothetical protein